MGRDLENTPLHWFQLQIQKLGTHKKQATEDEKLTSIYSRLIYYRSKENQWEYSNLATTERYMGSFDTSKTDETLRNVFAKKQSSATATEESGATKEEQAIQLLKEMTPEQIMAVISAINK